MPNPNPETRMKKTKKLLQSIYNEQEWQYPEPAYKSGFQWPKADRIRKLIYLAKEVGLTAINKKELAREFGVCFKTFYNDLNSMYAAGVDQNVVEQVKVDHRHTHNLIRKALEYDLSKCKTPGDRAKITEQLMKLHTEERNYLESFGMKEVASQTHEIKVTWAEDMPSKEDKAHDTTRRETTEKEGDPDGGRSEPTG